MICEKILEFEACVAAVDEVAARDVVDEAAALADVGGASVRTLEVLVKSSPVV